MAPRSSATPLGVLSLSMGAVALVAIGSALVLWLWLERSRESKANQQLNSSGQEQPIAGSDQRRWLGTRERGRRSRYLSALDLRRSWSWGDGRIPIQFPGASLVSDVPHRTSPHRPSATGRVFNRPPLAGSRGAHSPSPARPAGRASPGRPPEGLGIRGHHLPRATVFNRSGRNRCLP